MLKKYVLITDYADLKKDQIVYRCTKPTYGCLDPNEIAVTVNINGDYPFTGVPNDLLKEDV